MQIQDWLSILQALGIITASATAIWGINQWRRETKWKRSYELAEEVLASFYEVHHAIKIIRSPMGYSDEGKSRPEKENESPEEKEIFNQAWVSRERYMQNKQAFDHLLKLKFRFIALFGKEFESCFDVYFKTVNKIFIAADVIAMIKLGKYTQNENDNLKTNMAILYSRSEREDIIENQLSEALEKIENKCKQIIGKM